MHLAASANHNRNNIMKLTQEHDIQEATRSMHVSKEKLYEQCILNMKVALIPNDAFLYDDSSSHSLQADKDTTSAK